MKPLHDTINKQSERSKVNIYSERSQQTTNKHRKSEHQLSFQKSEILAILFCLCLACCVK